MQGFWMDGAWYPPIMGGDGTAGGAGGSGASAPGGTGEGGSEAPPALGEGAKGGEGRPAPGFTQEQVDSMIEKRLGRARKDWQKEQDEKAAKDKMSETERLEAEKKELEAQVNAQKTIADRRMIMAGAKIAAASEGVKADRVNAFVKLMGLSEIDMDDGGEPDETALKAEVAKVLGEFPEFKEAPGAGSSSSGGDFGGRGGEHIFTRQEIKEKTLADPDWFTKNEKEIDRQMQAGLIK